MMIPYKIKFVIDVTNSNHFLFESNEKPFKGDIFSIEEEGKLSEYIVTDVKKVVVRRGSSATLEYHCNVAPHDTMGIPIGFK